MKVIYHEDCLKHFTGANHPENKDRLTEIYGSIQDFGDEQIRAENGEPFINITHPRWYTDLVKTRCENLYGDHTYMLANDTPISRHSYTAACYSVGAAVEAADQARRGHKAFAIIRPPGHHAYRERTHGFCIFNNIAIAAEYLASRDPPERVLIVDIDIHLGDGTLDIVANSKLHDNLFYFSINQENIFPSLENPSTPNSKNIFLPAGTDDKKYTAVLESELPKTIKEFDPTIIAVSAGFDTHSTDKQNFQETMGIAFDLSNVSYKKLKEILDSSLVPYFLVLEGGYSPLGIQDGLEAFLSQTKVFI